ncbi:Kinesin, motor domain-containing protein [Cynara cardunculus var. scolymus]|uniref:Kinesin-like protein n=1 Tax=Cynara cardunculus var. scolymus TaxID=59895 RepID=A0A103YG23_CYNCS|nr:Kinesin, motor domain-containing protein [Cynara cardunculus var. scolymus]
MGAVVGCRGGVAVLCCGKGKTTAGEESLLEGRADDAGGDNHIAFTKNASGKRYHRFSNQPYLTLCYSMFLVFGLVGAAVTLGLGFLAKTMGVDKAKNIFYRNGFGHTESSVYLHFVGSPSQFRRVSMYNFPGGDQRSPGIIPLAVKDAFGIIQEVVNDLLNPAGQHLRIREDSQGTFVEGIKEEVVLSPGHALSIIAAGEEQRHVGSTNFNLHSSRSHTIFTLTIESSPCGENNEGEAVNLSQLNLIDLAGSESSKAETTGLRRKEGSYINKSLLTLGTVISKLTDGKAAHIPYRDSKLTRLLQSSLSGYGRVSLICAVTPSSSNSEETHNTLKFAHRAKHIEIQAAQNKIVDEKSLIKTYQNEIRSLKEELEQFTTDIATVPETKHTGGNDVFLKQKLEDGQVKLQSRLEQEEAAKAALLSQIQNLTKLILVSTKSSHSSRPPHQPAPRRYSFGEEELACLPHRRRDLILDDENIQSCVTLDEGTDTKNETLKEDKKIKKPGLLNWLKPRKRDSISRTLTSASDKSSGAKSTSTPSTPGDNRILPTESRHSYSSPSECTSFGFFSEARQDREINKDVFLQQEASPTSIKTIDQIDLLKEQQRILSGEVAKHFTALKRLSEEATRDTNKESIKSVPNLEAQLNGKSFELEIQAADNQEIQEQLNEKALEIEQLKQQVAKLSESKDQLEAQNKSLAEECSYAKELAADAATELKALSEEVVKLMNHNERLGAQMNSPAGRRTTGPTKNAQRNSMIHTRQKEGISPNQLELQRQLAVSKERERAYETMLSEKDQRESELQQTVMESKQREAYLENEVANMWMLVARLKRSQTNVPESTREIPEVNGLGIWDGI